MYLFKLCILNAKCESGSKQGWGECEDNWDGIPIHKGSQFRMQKRKKKKNNGRFPQILPLTVLKLGNPLFLTIEGSERSNFLLDKLYI